MFIFRKLKQPINSITMKSLFDEATFTEIQNRLNTLEQGSNRQWVKMTTAQMAHHCQLPLNIILEKETIAMKPNWLVNLLFKKSMYSNRPWRKNLPTIPRFKETEERDFKAEKTSLENLLQEFRAQRHRDDWKPHPAIGKLTKEQWGKMQYKHLDHHFRQFDV
jgi:hypothetical protein